MGAFDDLPMEPGFKPGAGAFEDLPMTPRAGDALALPPGLQRNQPYTGPTIGEAARDLVSGPFGQRLQNPTAPLIPSRTADQFDYLPMRKTGPNPGQWDWDPYAGVLGVLLRGLSSGGDVTRGTVPTPYSPGASAQLSSDLLSRATETASLLASPSPSYVAGTRYGTVPTQELPPPPSIGAIQKAADTATNRAAPGRVPILTQAERTEMLQTARGNREAVEAARNLSPGATPARSVLEGYGKIFAGNNWPSVLASSLPAAVLVYGGSGWKSLLAQAALRGSGHLANVAANAMARGQTRVAEELIRRNSPLGQSLLENLPLNHPPPVGRDQAVMQALIPGLLGGPPLNRLPPGFI